MNSASLETLIASLESPALIRLADASADDLFAATKAKKAFEALEARGEDPKARLASHFNLSKRQLAEIVEKNAKTTSMSFCRVAAAILQCSTRTVERAVRVGACLSAEIRKSLRVADGHASSLYRNQTELLHLCRHSEDRQRKIIALIDTGKVATVADAEIHLRYRKAPPQIAIHFEQDKRRWKSRSVAVRRELVNWLQQTGELETLLNDIRKNPDSLSKDAEILANYVSAADIATARLTNIPGSKKGILELGEREGWQFIETPGRGGLIRLFLIDDLPKDAQRELKRRRSIAGTRAANRKSSRDLKSAMAPTKTVSNKKAKAARG